MKSITVKKILFVLGTRPEAIKLAPLISQAKKSVDAFEVSVCVTAQHREMLDQALEIFQIQPDIDLNLMSKDQTLASFSSSALAALDRVLVDVAPDLVLVHGDTTTAYMASLAAFYRQVDIGHVEAGLRTGNLAQPFPEEFNRQSISRTAKFHFAPTNRNYFALTGEGVSPESIFVTGNTVVDALKSVLANVSNDPIRQAKIENELRRLLSFDWTRTSYVLVTAHRRENFGAGFNQITKALKILAKRFQDIHFVLPVHPNPHVRKAVIKALHGLKNLHLIDPLDYEPFVVLLDHAKVVLTDSGGLQEEAPSLGKPTIVMRDVTERPEVVEAGSAILVGADCERIVSATTELLSSRVVYDRMASVTSPFGHGDASKKIIDALKKYYGFIV